MDCLLVLESGLLLKKLNEMMWKRTFMSVTTFLLSF